MSLILLATSVGNVQYIPTPVVDFTFESFIVIQILCMFHFSVTILNTTAMLLYVPTDVALTHRGQEKMAANSLTANSNAFSWMKI